MDIPHTMVGRGIGGTRWTVIDPTWKHDLVTELAVSTGVHPLVVRCLVNRGITSSDQIVRFLNPDFLGDSHKPFLLRDMRKAVERLHRQGIDVIMMTGDARPVATAVAADLGIDTVLAEVLPEDKAAKVKEAQAQGERVAMVGDGVNDAPALLTADVGIAIGAGTDVAVEAGDVVLIRSDPRDVPRIIALSRATYRKMIQNLWWAAGYNIVAIPLAAGVLAPWGIVLHPAVGAVLMSLSTIIVAVNAQLLRRARL